MSDSAYWLSSDADNDESPIANSVEPNHKNTPNSACTVQSSVIVNNDTNNHNESVPSTHFTDSTKTDKTKANHKTSGKKRSQHELNLSPSTVRTKKRRLSPANNNHHTNNGNSKSKSSNHSNNRHSISKFKSSMLHEIQTIIGAKLHRNHVRKRVRCFCCDRERILRERETIKQYTLCDYWYCKECTMDDDIFDVLKVISISDDLDKKWIVQVYWNNEKQWKSAKIVSVEMKKETEEDDEMEVEDGNEITIIYLENEMEDTINLNDNDLRLRFINNNNGDKLCKILNDDNNNKSPSDTNAKVIYYEIEDETLLQYLVKYKNKSYLHCKWISYSDFIKKVDDYLCVRDEDGDIEMNKRKLMNDLVRIVRKWRKDERPSSYYESEDSYYYDPLFVEIDRIINDKTVKIKKKKQSVSESKQSKKYLVKWKGLSYDECSWELFEDLNAFNTDDINESIIKYNKLQKVLIQRKNKKKNKNKKKKKKRKICALNGHLSNLIKLRDGLELRDYQKEGVDWICYNFHEERSVLLCDEMGLGKTCQSICFLEYLHNMHDNDGPFLVIAPLSTLIHWKREIERFSTMYGVIYQGNKESRVMIEENEFYYGKSSGGIFKFNVLIMSYDMVMMERSKLSKIPFKVMIIDEAHRIKNRECKLYGVLSGFKHHKNKESMFKILLTGTPIQNNISEFWSLLNFVDDKYFNNLNDFSDKYGSITRLEQLDELRCLLGSHVLRRLKCDVEKQLLPRTEMIIYVELTKCQKAFYRAVFEKNIEYLNAKSSVKSLRNIAMTLRKVCLHPYLLCGAEQEELKRNNIKLPPQINQSKDEDINDEYHNKDEVLSHLVSVSGKFVLIDKLLDKLRSEGHKVLIYSQFTSLLDILEDYLLWKSYLFERIDGSTSLTDRQEAIDNFVENASCFIFLLSTRAGGVGINLIAADTVIIFDSDWNPQNDIQAQSRCHRIGQNKKVSVYRLITRDSYEVYLFEKAISKLVLDDLVMAASTKNKKQQKTNDDLEELLKKSAEKLMNPQYDQENEEKMTLFYKNDIETILNENTVKVDNIAANQSIFQNLNLSKAMFVPKEKETEKDSELLKMDDPDFWKKLGFEDIKENEKEKDKEKEQENKENEDTNFKCCIVSDKSIVSSSNLMLNGIGINGKRSRKRTIKYSNFNEDIWDELGSDFENFTDSDHEEKPDSDYDEVEDAKHHQTDDDDDDDEDNHEIISINNNNNSTVNKTNPSYLGKTTSKASNINNIQIINIVDDDEEDPKKKHKHKKKKKKHKHKHKHKHKKKKKSKQIIDIEESCNPLSDSFCAVDYLKHRTPLYQVNTINIDNIYQRKGELSTAHFIVGDWKFRVLVYPFGVDNPSYSLMNNSYLSVYLHYLGRADNKKDIDEQIQTEFRCTIHSCLGSQQDLYQELQHKFSIKSKVHYLSGFKNFLPLSLLFRTPFYLFPDPNQSKDNSVNQSNKDKEKDNNKEKESNQNQKRNMAILKTELWIFPPLNWKKAKPVPKSPIYIDLLDDDDDDDDVAVNNNNNNNNNDTPATINIPPASAVNIPPNHNKMPTLEKAIDDDDDDDNDNNDNANNVDNNNNDNENVANNNNDDVDSNKMEIEIEKEKEEEEQKPQQKETNDNSDNNNNKIPPMIVDEDTNIDNDDDDDDDEKTD